VAELIELLEGQLDLIDQPHRAFRALAVDLPRQFLDLQALMGNQGLIVGGPGLGHRQFGFDPCRPSALRDQRRL
jgi:hypothetical protein